MEYAALFAGEQPSQLALATSGAARVAHAAGAELSVVRSMCRDWERRALDALLKAAVAEQLSSTLAEACGSRPHQLRRIIEGATVPESAAAFVGAEPTARLAMLEAAAAAPFTFTEEKRIIADFFWHASRKAWSTDLGIGLGAPAHHRPIPVHYRHRPVADSLRPRPRRAQRLPQEQRSLQEQRSMHRVSFGFNQKVAICPCEDD
jgi:hypothetical protein